MSEEKTQKELTNEAIMNAPLLTIAYKTLLTIISFTIALLFGLVISLFCTGSIQSFINCINGIKAKICIDTALLCVLLFAILAILYAVLKKFSTSKASHSYCIIFARYGIILPFISTVALSAINMTIAITNNCQVFPSVLLSVLILFISVCPIAVTWRIYEEDRLKNFIDGISKTLACLAVLAGAIAVIAD